MATADKTNGRIIQFSRIVLQPAKFIPVPITDDLTVSELLEKQGIRYNPTEHYVLHPAPMGAGQHCMPTDRITPIHAGDFLIVLEFPREMTHPPLPPQA